MLARVTFWLVVLAYPAVPAFADYRDSFKAGVEAVNREQWQEAVTALRLAIAEQPNESDERIFISGVFSRPYLPRFFLGWALTHWDPKNCEEALSEWSVSEQAGVIVNFKKLYQDLQSARANCTQRLLPAALATAEEAVRAGETLAASLSAPVHDQALEAERTTAIDQLAEARSLLAEGRGSQQLITVRDAERQARSAATRLSDVSARLESASRVELSEELAAARAEIRTAESAQESLRRLLEDPQRAAVWQLHPEITMSQEAVSRLESARRRLQPPETLASAQWAANEARAAALLWSDLERRALELWTRTQREPNPASTKSLVVSPRGVPDIAAEQRPAASAGAAAAENRSPGLDRWIAVAGQLLDLVGDQTLESPILETQRSRLTLLVSQARALIADGAAAEAPRLATRLASSATAFRLVAGAQALFDGETSRAVEILGGEPIEAGPFEAQSHLLLAAASFRVFRLQEDPRSRQVSIDSILRCRALGPEVAPTRSHFSPDFVDLFEQTTSAVEHPIAEETQ